MRVNKTDEQLVQVLEKTNNIEVQKDLLQLLGWAEPVGKYSDLLIKYLAHDDYRLRNAAARSLFPMLASGKVKCDPQIIFDLLHRETKYDKNKALGIILHSDWIKIPNAKLKYIQRLTQHEEKMISIPARRIASKS